MSADSHCRIDPQERLELEQDADLQCTQVHAGHQPQLFYWDPHDTH